MDELTTDDRRIVKVALRNHADDLRKESKKVQDLGHEMMAVDLNLEAGRITERLLPLFDDQTTLALVSEEGENGTGAPEGEAVGERPVTEPAGAVS